MVIRIRGWTGSAFQPLKSRVYINPIAFQLESTQLLLFSLSPDLLADLLRAHDIVRLDDGMLEVACSKPAFEEIVKLEWSSCIMSAILPSLIRRAFHVLR